MEPGLPLCTSGTATRAGRKCIYISYEYVLPKASIPVSKLLVEIACHPLLYLHHAVKIAFVMAVLSIPRSLLILLSLNPRLSMLFNINGSN